MKVRTSMLSKFWKNHISDKYGFGGDTTALRGSTEGHLLQRDGGE